MIQTKGEIFVIRPQQPIMVDRIEKDVDKLTDLYEQGYECGKSILAINI